jgi:hypothetical protein
MKLTQLALRILLLVLTGCATSSRNTWQQGTTTINVTGTPGERIAGFYVQDGQRHPIASSVPFTLSEPFFNFPANRNAVRRTLRDSSETCCASSK